MKLARKIALTLIVAIVAVMAAYAWYQMRGEVVLFDSQLKQNARRGRALVASIQSIYRNEGEQRTRALVEELAGVMGDISVRWVNLDVPRGAPGHVELSAEDREVLADGRPHEVLRTQPNGDVDRRVYVPVAPDNPLALEASESMHRQQTFIRTSHNAILIATMLIAALCGLIALGLGFWLVGRPIELLREKARRAGRGDLSGPLVLKQHDEMAELADDINAMCERIAESNARLAAETEARLTALGQLRHAERLATIGRLSAGVAHELGTPLNVVGARAEMIGSDETSTARARDHARVIVEQSARMADIIRQLLDFSRRRGPTLGAANLPQIVARAIDLLETTADTCRVRLDYVSGAAPMLVQVDQNQIQQVLANIMLNGIQAMPSGGRLRVRVDAMRARPPTPPGVPEGDYFAVMVEDEGHGIAAEDLPHIFEPFFTTKATGEGTGLGLAVAHGIISDHGGWIDVTTTAGGGCRFIIYLPPAAGTHAQLVEAAS